MNEKENNITREEQCAKMLHEICELKMLKELKRFAREKQAADAEIKCVTDVPYDVVSLFYNKLIKKSMCVIRNVYTGKICCDVDGDFLIFNNMRDARKYMNGYGCGLNTAVYQVQPLTLDVVGGRRGQTD